MDFFINKVSQQAVTFAIKSGITVTTTFAINHLTKYISSIRGKERRELLSLQEKLATKIQIISPAIDLVEIISARGNTSLESALTLTKTIRHDIQSLGVRVSDLTNQEGGRKRRKSPDEISAIVKEIRSLLEKIEDAVPFINLAITTSGVELSSNIPHNVSPSRLLQASTLLTAGDTAYALNPFDPAQIGTTFTLSLYMLFAGHSHRQEQVSAKDLTWQEVIYKCKVKLQRVPLFYDEEEGHGTKQMRAQSKIEEYCYELCLIEDLDDGRAHEVEEINQPFGGYEDVSRAGLRTRIPIHQISKLFYTNSGTLLGIEDSNSPILLIKRDINATPSRRLAERVKRYEQAFEDSDEDEESTYALDMGEGKSFWDPENGNQNLPEEYDLPRHLDPEWLALEVFMEPPEDEDDFEAHDSSQYDSQDELLVPPSPVTDGSHVKTDSLATFNRELQGEIHSSPPPPRSYHTNMKSSLSILECLLRLTILQNYQQTSHLAVHDELLNLFLSDSAWSGSRESIQLERENTRRRIGFDPFSSPTKQQQPPQENKKQPQIRGIRGTVVPVEQDVRSPQGNRMGTPSRLSTTEVGRPTTPSSERRPATLSPSKTLALAAEPWTPEQQLCSTFDNTCISNPLLGKVSISARNPETPEDPDPSVSDCKTLNSGTISHRTKSYLSNIEAFCKTGPANQAHARSPRNA